MVLSVHGLRSAWTALILCVCPLYSSRCGNCRVESLMCKDYGFGSRLCRYPDLRCETPSAWPSQALQTTFNAVSDNGKPATKVFGQPDFFTITAGSAANQLNG